MARWSYLIVAVYVVLAVGYAQQEVTKAAEVVANTTTVPVETTTNEAPDTTTATTKATTPSTTTTKATTTTTTNTTTTTTQKPTTAAPTPKPDQPDWPRNVGKWLVNETQNPNSTCLALSAAIEINVVEGSPSKTSSLNIPTTANANGTCSENEVTIEITWEKNSLLLVFAKNETSKKSALKEITVDVTTANGTVVKSLVNQTFFEVPLNKSYKCTKETSIRFDSEVELKIASLQVEAFHQNAFDNYSAALECAIDDVSPVVPLAVGISLAVLVVIVLIAYLIGRSRSRARGYQSV